LDILINKEKTFDDLDKNIKFLYPKWIEYELFVNEQYTPIPHQVRNVMEIQTIRTLSVFKVGTKLYNTIFNLVSYMWKGVEIPEFETNRYQRDISILKSYYPMIKDTLPGTLDQFTGDYEDKVKAVILLLLKLYDLRDRQIKAIVYGPSTTDIRETYYMLSERNSSIALTHMIKDVEMKQMLRSSHDSLYLRHNHYILAKLHLDELSDQSFVGLEDSEIVDLMMDPSVGKSIKKRLFMPLLAEGKITEIEVWSETTSMILHYWEVRQKFIKQTNEWSGNMDLILFLGRKRFRIVYREETDKYIMYKSEFEESELLYEFIIESCDILGLTIDQLLSKTHKGDWVIKNKQIIFNHNQGFNITTSHISNPIYNIPSKIIVDDDKTTLIEQGGKKILSIPTGLINTDLRTSELPDILVYGLSFSKLVKHGCFAKHFNLDYRPIDVVRDLVDDIYVPKPNISSQTKLRLNLKDDWKLRDLEDEEKEETTVEINKEEVSDPFEWFIENDSELEDIKKTIQWDVDPIYNFVDEFISTDFFTNLQIVVDVQFPRRTLSFIRNLKYDCITLLVTTTGGVNRSTMESLSSTIENGRREIIYSLISRYDRYVGSSGLDSPEVVIMRLDKKLDQLGVTRKLKDILI